MKKITLMIFSLLISIYGFSQVGISENFDSGTPAGWTDDYSNTSTAACSGNSERNNLYSFNDTGNLTSPNQVAASNGTDLTVSFDYQILEYTFGTPTDATPPGWGSAELQYSIDDGTNWTTVLTIDDTNHITANTCATMMVTVPAASLPVGSDVKLQIANTWIAGDYYFYVDNFSASQVVTSPPNCDSVLSETTDVSVDGDISWSTASGIPTGYFLTVGTSSGATDVVNNVDVGNTTAYNLGVLMGGATYYVTITPYNANGSATGCTEQTFTTSVPPANDLCINPITVQVGVGMCGADVTGTNIDASDSGEPTTSCATTNYAGGDIWYEFTVPAGETAVTYNRSASDFSTTFVALYDGSCGALTELFCSTSALVDFTGLTAGNTYLLRLFDWGNNDFGDVTFCLGTPAPAPANNDCANATPITESSDSTCSSTVSGTTMGATNSADYGACSTTYEDVWYSFMPSATGVYLINRTLTSGTATTYLNIWSGSCGALTQVNSSCFSTSLSETLTAGTQYYISVASFTPTVDFDLCVYPAPPPPTNDEPSGAEALTVGTLFADNQLTATNISATASEDSDATIPAPGCSSYSGGDVWYTVVVPANGLVTIETNRDASSSPVITDTGMAVYSGNIGAFTIVECDDDDSLDGAHSRIDIDDVSLAGQTLYVRVFEYGNNAFGNWFISAYVPPNNDECAGAESLTIGATVVGDNSGSSKSSDAPACNNVTNRADVWYAFNSGSLTSLNLLTDPGYFMQVWSGTCGSLTQVTNGCGEEMINDLAVTANTDYYLQIWSDRTAARAAGAFSVTVQDATLSIDSNEFEGFKYFPNPVEGTLSLRAQDNIQAVAIYNMLGQEIMRAAPNKLSDEIDMSGLNAGAYFVKVKINNVEGNFRIIKQ